ncbi:MAG TPA: SgcJ/EcaC family oxidoreductase, partial [Dactylosporangium sp.]|nr:SgcJ/EcaC family oxidoreductase [Dactylosporangium sp.]
MSAPSPAGLVEAVTRAWSDGDAEAFAAHYAPDATAILPGFHLRDRAGIRSAMGEAFAGPLRGSRRVHEIRAERRYGADTAVLVTRSATVPAGEAEPAP